MLDCIRLKHAFDPARTIMVGDRLDTDILFGKRGGVSTLVAVKYAIRLRFREAIRTSLQRESNPPESWETPESHLESKRLASRFDPPESRFCPLTILPHYKKGADTK